MNIFIDESGSFVRSDNRESWNAVVAVASAESARRTISEATNLVKRDAGISIAGEVKLHQIDEQIYLRFLNALRHNGLIVFATTTDAGLNTFDRVARHQAMQVNSIREAIPKMRFDGGRKGVELLAAQIESLSPQLYVQLVCQVGLLHDLISRSINYFAQRIPATLREFRWRIDQKNTTRTTFEDAFEKIAPALLQTRSIREPLHYVEGFDYRHMTAYEYEDGNAPKYLETDYGLPRMQAINVQKIIRGNIKFGDSKNSPGIQTADLLASGLRRLLRNGFHNNAAIASAFSHLTLQNVADRHSIIMTSFAEEEALVTAEVSRIIRTLNRGSKGMNAR